MNTLLQLIGAPGASGAALVQPAIALTLALLLGQLTAWVYMHTHAGVSYSRAFVQSIVLLTVIVTLAMMVIGNNMVIAFGLLGALSMIRFRNVLKDTRDTSFVFFAVVIGIACGTGGYGLGVAGALLFVAVVAYLHVTTFGSKRNGDAFLRFETAVDTWKPLEIQAVIRRHCLAWQMVSQRIAETGAMELAFQLVMRDRERGHALVEDLRKEGLTGVSFMLQADESEV